MMKSKSGTHRRPKWCLDIFGVEGNLGYEEEKQILSTLGFEKMFYTGGMGVFVHWFRRDKEYLWKHSQPGELAYVADYRNTLLEIKSRLPFQTPEVQTTEYDDGVAFNLESGESIGMIFAWPDKTGEYRFFPWPDKSEGHEKMVKLVHQTGRAKCFAHTWGRRLWFSVVDVTETESLKVEDCREESQGSHQAS